jgi:alpha-amylase/alpha-mannosidase (GH57 family)
MKNQRAVKRGTTVAATLAVDTPIHSRESNRSDKKEHQLLERWRRLATGLRGVRLFKVTLPEAGTVFWEAECTLNGTGVCRRFASELHARAWLSVATQSRMSLSSVEKQELHRPCSTSCFASGG